MRFTLFCAALLAAPIAAQGAVINEVSYDDSSITDYQAGIGYETDIGLGIEAGLRSFQIDYDDSDDDEEADLTIDGIYAGVFYHF